MPRHDGLDTNKEMQVDFQEKSHDIFTTAFDRRYNGTIPDALKGKPVSALGLRVISKAALDKAGKRVTTPDTVGDQRLIIESLTSDNANYLQHNHVSARNYPEYVHDANHAAVKKLAETTMQDGISLTDSVPVHGIKSDYAAVVENGLRRTSTLDDKPSKLNLSLAKTFANETSDFVHGGLFTLGNPEAPPPRPGTPSNIAQLAEMIRSQKDIDLNFFIQVDPEVPLNGHESKAYLEAYVRKVKQLIEDSEKRLSSGLLTLSGYEDEREEERLKQHRLVLALSFAQAYLEQK